MSANESNSVPNREVKPISRASFPSITSKKIATIVTQPALISSPFKMSVIAKNPKNILKTVARFGMNVRFNLLVFFLLI